MGISAPLPSHLTVNASVQVIGEEGSYDVGVQVGISGGGGSSAGSGTAFGCSSLCCS